MGYTNEMGFGNKFEHDQWHKVLEQENKTSMIDAYIRQLE